MAPVRLAGPLCVLAVSILASCGGGGAFATPVSLAEGFRPRALDEVPASIGGEGGPRVQAVRLEDGLLRVTVGLPRDAWLPTGKGLWVTPRPFSSLADAAPGARSRLVAGSGPGSRELPALSVPERPGTRPAELPDGVPPPQLARALRQAADPAGFHPAGRWLHLCWPAGEELPDAWTFEEALPLGDEANGRWRVHLPGLAADGVPLLPGLDEELVLDVPPRSILRCAAAAVAGEGSPTPEPLLSVELDGHVLVSRTLPTGPRPEPEYLDLTLPSGGVRGARLRLSVRGPACLAALIDPVILPADAPPRAERERPDVVLLLADTYRADNLAAWGGDPELAPHLNALAERSLRFVEAQTPGTWTLPSHASMFAGLYPPQLGVLERTDRLGAAAHTLAEHFAAAGYRTAAVTESLYVSRTFGMDQGFAWFEEHDGDVAHTVERARALLARDDGRPLLLFVHSYRAHDPYLVSPATRARLGERYDWSRGVDTFFPTIVKSVQTGRRGTPVAGEGAAAFAGVEAYYRGASADLDAGFGELLRSLEEDGFLDRGVLVFTSDHGEAFGEHGIGGHGSGVWQEQSHVPLCLVAPGVAAGVDDTTASLIDLPRTLCGVAGIEPHPGWLGRDLLNEPAGAPVFAFQTRTVQDACDLAVVRGSRKLIFGAHVEEPERPDFAYDLAQDPGELRDLAGEAETAELLERILRPLRVVRERLHAPETAVLNADQRARLEEMGYGGDS